MVGSIGEYIGSLQELYIWSPPVRLPSLAISVLWGVERMREPVATSWQPGVSASPASLAPWASGATGSRGRQLLPSTLVDLHAVDVVLEFAVIELASVVESAVIAIANADANASANAGG